MKLSEIRQILATDGIQLTKSLGQNFLHDANQLRRIVKLAEIQPRDQILEIGPGLGPLTELLLKSGSTVLAIEKDRRLASILETRFAGESKFKLVTGDALEYIRSNVCDWPGWKVVSNLPYSVASPILVDLAQNSSGPEMFVVTLQLEVVRRLLAKPGTADYGLLTVLVQAWYKPSEWFPIPRTCFFPAPDVDSGCIKLVRRPDVAMMPKFSEIFRLVAKKAFSQRRKMMFKLLKPHWPEAKLAAGFAALNLPQTIRAEQLSPQQFLELTKFLV